MRNPVTQAVELKYTTLKPLLDERARRLWAAVEARSLGRGGIIRVAEATGLARRTIRTGLKELDLPVLADDRSHSSGRLRRPGGGRKPVVDHDPRLLLDLEALVDPVTRGDPMSPLRWTCKSAALLAEGLKSRGHVVSERTVNRLLHDMGDSLQSNRKSIEGKGHLDRDAQFQDINRRAKGFQRHGQPVVSVDTKKKELVGQDRNGGREWQPKGRPEKVKVHDFIDKDLGKAIPYGVYDMAANTGWVSVGVDHDTAEFAVETVRRWWRGMGSRVYPQAKT
jgi:Rhodopirellula transposase DDE domain